METAPKTAIPHARDLRKFQHGPGPVKGVTITEFQALRYLRAVMTKFRAWNDPDRSWFSDNPPVLGDMPYVYWNWEDRKHPAIVWEGGSPHEWAYGIEHEYRDPEFGGRVPGVPVPAQVFAEPYWSFVLSLYPA